MKIETIVTIISTLYLLIIMCMIRDILHNIYNDYKKFTIKYIYLAIIYILLFVIIISLTFISR